MNGNLFFCDKFSRQNRVPLSLMYITNHPEIAKIAEKSGVDRIWIDLETIGKEQRQFNMNTVKSDHVLSDIPIIRNVLSKSKLLVRINPLYDGSKKEIDKVVDGGADIIMLPWFHTQDEAKKFVDLVDGRAKTILLVETTNAEKNIKEILATSGADEIHIGLNDLHLEYKMTFMFELLINGAMDRMLKIIHDSSQIHYGFGGIARLDEGMLPARLIIAEHYRMGSQMAILSRSFYDSWVSQDIDEIEAVFRHGVSEIREYEERLKEKEDSFFIENHNKVVNIVKEIVNRKRAK